MAIFRYELRNKQGEIEKGTIAGVSYDHAAKKLVAKGGELIKLIEEKPTFFETLIRIKKRDIITFTRGLATLQKAGVSMLGSLNSLMEMAGNAKLKRIEQDIIMGVESGVSFSDTLARFPRVFDPLYISMIKVAEASGKLDEVLERLYESYEREEDLKSQLTAAMAYPIVVSLAITGIIFLILAFVVPRFVDVFANIGMTMPFATQVLVTISNFLRRRAIILIPGVIIIFIIFKGMVRRGRVRLIYDTFKLRIPIAGGFVQKLVLSRFTKGLRILLESGVPMLESFKLVSATVGNEAVAQDIKQLSKYVANGGRITDFIKVKKMFPLLVVQMISVGEETGTLSKMLGEVADFYEQEIQRGIKALLNVLEPLMIIVLGGIVGGILITLMMPLFTMMKGFRI